MGAFGAGPGWVEADIWVVGAVCVVLKRRFSDRIAPFSCYLVCYIWLFVHRTRGRLLARCGYIWQCVALGFEEAKSRRPPVTGSRMWRCAGLGFALEDFDDDHIAATARADEPRLFGWGVS